MNRSFSTIKRVTALERIVSVSGCRACRDRPTRLYFVNDEPEPQLDCSVCGRHVVLLVRRNALVPNVGA